MNRPSYDNEINRFINFHTLLPNTSISTIKNHCIVAKEKFLYAVCIPPYYVPFARNFLASSLVKLSTVINYPMGYSTTSAKIEEIKRASDDGVDEIGILTNIAAIRNNDWRVVNNDLKSIMTIADIRNISVKLILEIDLLEQSELSRLGKIAHNTGIEWFQTSSEFRKTEIRPNDILKLRKCLPSSAKIEAWGMVNSLEKANGLINAGASRIGTSNIL